MRTNMESRWIMDLAYERGADETCLYRKSPPWGNSFGEGLDKKHKESNRILRKSLFPWRACLCTPSVFYTVLQ